MKTIISYAVGLALCVAMIALVTVMVQANKPISDVDPLTEELSTITIKFNQDWDVRRGDADNAEQRARMREEWRSAYHHEVRECCKRHNRSHPKWANEVD